jgi:uncharacterized membrane protein
MRVVQAPQLNPVPPLRLQLVVLHVLVTKALSMNLKIRHYLLTGLLVWLPMGVTVWLLTWLVGTMDGIFLAVLGALDAGIDAIFFNEQNIKVETQVLQVNHLLALKNIL